MGIIDPSPLAFKQRRGSYFYYNRAAIGLACAQATAMRIDIAPHKRPRKKTLTTFPTPATFTSLHTPTSTISNPRHSHHQLDAYRNFYALMMNIAPPPQPAPERLNFSQQPPELENALFACFNPVPDSFADTLLKAGGFDFLAHLYQENPL